MSGLSTICRLCMNKFSSLGLMENIFFGEAHIAETIRIVTHIEIVKGDGLPTYVCRLCIFKLNNAKNFIQSCIKSDEQLKLEFTTGALSLTASNANNSESTESTLAAAFHGQLKTEPSSSIIEHVSNIAAHVTDEQHVNPLALVENEDEVYLKYEIFDETDPADICGPALDNENNELPELKPGTVFLTLVPGSSLLEPTETGIEERELVHQQGINEGPSIELSIENSDLEIKRENIDAYNDDESLLPAVADEPHEPEKIDSQVCNNAQEDIVPDLIDPILPLHAVLSASSQELGCHSENSAVPALGHESSTETVTVDVHRKNSIDSEPESPRRVPQVPTQPSSERIKSAKKSSLLRLARKRKKGLQCKDCCRVFSRLSVLRHHNCNSIESSEDFDCHRMFECNLCLAGFSSRTSLGIHKKLHTKNSSCNEELELLSQTSDFDVNSSDSESSIFELNIPDSEGSNNELKNFDSDESDAKVHTGSDDHVVIFNSDLDSCEINSIGFETDVSGSNSDLEEAETDTSLESGGSGLIPNSGSESNCRSTSSDSDDSERNPEDSFSEPDMDSSQGTVTSTQNSERKKNVVNEYQVCSTKAQNTSRNELNNKGEQLQDSRTNPTMSSGESGFSNNSSGASNEDSTEGLPIPCSDACNSPVEQCIQIQEAGHKQKRKRSCADSDSKDLPMTKRRPLNGSMSENPEKLKRGIPCVQPGESGGILARVGPVFYITRSRIRQDPNLESQSVLCTEDSCVRESIFGKKKNGKNDKPIEQSKPKTTTSFKLNGVDDGCLNEGEMSSAEENQMNNEVSEDNSLEKEIKERESEKTRLGERGELKQSNHLILEGAEVIKTEEHKPDVDKVTKNVVVESVKKSAEKAKAKRTKENGRSSKISSHLSFPVVDGQQNLGEEIKCMQTDDPVSSYQCWECSRKFDSGEELITHFCQHLRALLLMHTS